MDEKGSFSSVPEDTLLEHYDDEASFPTLFYEKRRPRCLTIRAFVLLQLLLVAIYTGTFFFLDYHRRGGGSSCRDLSKQIYCNKPLLLRI